VSKIILIYIGICINFLYAEAEMNQQERELKFFRQQYKDNKETIAKLFTENQELKREIYKLQNVIRNHNMIQSDNYDKRKLEEAKRVEAIKKMKEQIKVK